MLCLYTGTPGSGKSLHAAKLMRDRLRWAKCPVIANFDVSHEVKGYADWFHYVPNHELTPAFLREFALDYWDGRKPREDEIILVVDEAQLLFNSRDWQQKDRMSWVEFLSQHRHFGYYVVFMTQTDRMLDRQIRALAEFEFNHRKVSSFGFLGKLASVLLLGHQLFVCVRTYHGLTGKAASLGSSFIVGTKSLYAFYDSYSTFERVEGEREGGDVRGPAERAPSARSEVVRMPQSA